MKNLLGLHWLRHHPDRDDLPHIEAMQYNSIKPFGELWGNRDAAGEVLSVLPKDSLVLARDHPLSEQKQDMEDDPDGTGIRHANEWAFKVASGQYHFPVERTYFLGINEPNADSGDRDKIDRYTASYLNRLKVHGLRGGAFNFSTGHPRTDDGTASGTPDYEVFYRSHEAIVVGGHIGVLHIYGTGAVPAAPGHYNRLASCSWQDVRWVVGEFGIDEHVIGGGEHFGYQHYFEGRLEAYCEWLDNLIISIADSRILSYQVFTYDFSKPWGSFNIQPIRAALQNYNWRHLGEVKTHIPSVSKDSLSVVAKPLIVVPTLTHPIANVAIRKVTHEFGEQHGGVNYFGFKGHLGVDFAAPSGTPIRAVDNGFVLESGDDPDGYGLYIKIMHEWGQSLYAHLKEKLVQLHATVNPGHVIGYSGATGQVSGPHLHFGIRVYPYKRGFPYDGYSDPMPYLKPSDTVESQTPILTAIKAAAKEIGLEWQLLASLAWAESSFRPGLEDGLFQIGDATWEDWASLVGAKDINDPLDNSRVAAHYLHWLLGMVEGDVFRALVAYNFGIGNVLDNIDPPAVTLNYVNKVIAGRDLLKAVGA